MAWCSACSSAGSSGTSRPVRPSRPWRPPPPSPLLPKNTTARAQLANLYFDAERSPEAITWYEQAFALDPTSPDVSTDLGVSYYYSNDADKALAQFDKSLALDPKHVKTLLNQGIVRAFGKQDMAGATVSWQKVVDVAPGTPEAAAAQRALESLKSAAHQAGGAAPAGQ